MCWFGHLWKLFSNVLWSDSFLLYIYELYVQVQCGISCSNVVRGENVLKRLWSFKKYNCENNLVQSKSPNCTSRIDQLSTCSNSWCKWHKRRTKMLSLKFFIVKDFFCISVSRTSLSWCCIVFLRRTEPSITNVLLPVSWALISQTHIISAYYVMLSVRRNWVAAR